MELLHDQNNGKNGTTTALESRARSLLASSIRTVGYTPNQKKFIYPVECNDETNLVEGFVDSTTALLTARTFSKLGRSDLAWDFLRTLFAAQGSDGFMPRFVYLEEEADEHEPSRLGWEMFIGSYPGPKLFYSNEEVDECNPKKSSVKHKHQKHGEESSQPQEDLQAHHYPKCEGNVRIWSSNTIRAQPHHSTIILEIFYLSNQTLSDVNNLELYYEKAQRWHGYLHKQIISNCSSFDQVHTQCIPVNHPWETEVEISSSLVWDRALENVTKIVAHEGWKPNYEIPDAVKNSFDYPGDVTYTAMLYLLECLSNNTGNGSNEHSTIPPTNEQFQSTCPFQMIDVGFTAALSKADHDLIQIGQVLTDKNLAQSHLREEMQLDRERSHHSKRMLYHLYDEEKGSFFNQVVNLELNANGTYSSNYTTQLELPIGSNFLSFWDNLSNSTMVETQSSQLLQRRGEFSFYCNDYPLWTLGGCGDPESFKSSGLPSNSATIQLLLNYRVSKGLGNNQQIGLGHFLQRSTLNMICGLPNSDESDLNNCIDNQQFAFAYNATSNQPLGSDMCSLTSTLTAAIVLEMLIPDKAFAYTSAPPISSSSVIFLIAAEMVVAFGVGIICLVLSFSLMRRAQADDEGDSFVQMMNQQQEEELLLVQSPGVDAEDEGTTINGEVNNVGAVAWSLELLSRVFGG